MTSAKQPQVRLRHMLDNNDGVLEMTAGLHIDSIVLSFAAIRATERAIQIISEAAKELPPTIRETEPGVPWRNIIGIGNLLRHEYYRIDPSVLEAILRVELPSLRAAVLPDGAFRRMNRRLGISTRCRHCRSITTAMP